MKEYTLNDLMSDTDIYIYATSARYASGFMMALSLDDEDKERVTDMLDDEYSYAIIHYELATSEWFPLVIGESLADLATQLDALHARYSQVESWLFAVNRVYDLLLTDPGAISKVMYKDKTPVPYNEALLLLGGKNEHN